ncbi:MAG: diguanylate cyclase [Betaproteobacteria bacterium]|nr:diguanylate cyclase [Betaproteobacteria bacterium]
MSVEFGRTLRVLVVDDDQSILALLRKLLESVGFEVELAERIASAAGFLDTRKFDLVLLDQELPDGNGLDLARKLLEDGNADCEVVLMSAHASISSTVEAIRVQAADFLVKPFDRRDELLSRIRRVVEVQAVKRSNRQLVEELRATNRVLEAMAVRDSLTGLYNHAYFHQCLEAEIARSKRHRAGFALIFFDLDHFKHINDTFGHQAGDKVLKGLAGALHGRTAMEKMGVQLRPHDVAVRYGGDEFVLILPETDRGGASAKAERLREYMERNSFDDRVPSITLSIGVACYPEDGRNREDLLRAADTALYAAKALGRNRVAVYGPHLASADARGELGDSRAARRVAALERSIDERAFSFVYQPIVRAGTWEVFAYEGLCRPSAEAFPTPSDLIVTAERAGMIRKLGRVLREMVVEPLPRLGAGGCIFVNVHPYELNDPELLADGGALLDQFSSQIVFEVIEAGKIRDYAQFREALVRLRERGFRVALDDLGAGYSGLNALALLEPDFVKLDSVLLRGVDADNRKSRLIKHILEYAVGEGVQVIAEGIESEQECRVVTELGCPLLQGYHLAPPGKAFVPVREPGLH